MKILKYRSIIYFVSTFILGLILQTFVRFYFFLNHWSGSNLSIDIFKAFCIGVKFDSMILAYVFFPLLFILLFRFGRKAQKYLIEPYLVIIYSILIIVGIVDTEYFRFFSSHLSLWAIDYLESPAIVYLLITSQYNVFLLGGALVCVLLLCYLLTRLIRRIYTDKNQLNWILRFLSFIIFTFVLVVFARSSVSLAPGDWGMAYFSKDHFVNQLALNGTYTLVKTLQEIKGDKDYELSTEQATIDEVNKNWISASDSVTSEVIKRVSSRSSGNDFALGEYNVVMIVLESWSHRYISSLGGPAGHTPNFDSLMTNNYLFTQLYASGSRSVNGLTALYFGFPTTPGRSLMKRYIADKPYMSVAQSLKPHDYSSLFVYGGDIDFDNMGGSLKESGFDKLLGQSDFPSESSLGKWGVPDGILFQRFLSEIENLPRPFFATTFTLTSHDPFDLPKDFPARMPMDNRENKFLATIQYSDSCLGAFFDFARQQTWFDSTIFIISADHGTTKPSKLALEPEIFHIGGGMILPKELDVFVHDSLKFERIVKRTISQTDLLPSVYDLLGIGIEHKCHGVSMFDTTKIGSAYFAKGDLISLIQNDSIFVKDVGKDKKWLFYRKNAWQEAQILRKDCEYIEKYNTLNSIMHFTLKEISGDI